MPENTAGPLALKVEIQRYDAVTVLSIDGDVDLATAPQLTDAISEASAIADFTALIVDLTGVPFFASVGMTVLIEASRRVGADARFAVVADGPATSRPMTMMGLDRAFAIYTNLDAALKDLTVAPD